MRCCKDLAAQSGPSPRGPASLRAATWTVCGREAEGGPNLRSAIATAGPAVSAKNRGVQASGPDQREIGVREDLAVPVGLPSALPRDGPPPPLRDWRAALEAVDWPWYSAELERKLQAEYQQSAVRVCVRMMPRHSDTPVPQELKPYDLRKTVSGFSTQTSSWVVMLNAAPWTTLRSLSRTGSCW